MQFVLYKELLRFSQGVSWSFSKSNDKDNPLTQCPRGSLEQFGSLKGTFQGNCVYCFPHLFSRGQKLTTQPWRHTEIGSVSPYHSLPGWIARCPCPLSLCIPICRMKMIVICAMNMIVRIEIPKVLSTISDTLHIFYKFAYYYNWHFCVLVFTSSPFTWKSRQ